MDSPIGGPSGIVRSSPLVGQGSFSSPKSLKKLEDPIEEIDAMAAAIEELGQALPMIDPLISPVKSKRSSIEPSTAIQAKISKTPQGRPSITKRTGPIATRNSSVNIHTGYNAQNANNKASRQGGRTSSTANRIRSSSSTAKTVDYLASRRPSITLKFPTPPSAPKNVKPHVVPEFRLPSDALAAKFRAQREERLRKEKEEEAARRVFKARPVPKSLGATTGSAYVGPRPTAATKARENLMREAKADVPLGGKDGQTQQSTRRSGLVDATSSTASLDKRRSMIIASAQNEKRSAQRVSSITPLQSQTASRRNSAIGSSSHVSGPVKKPSVAAVPDAAALRAKGREVFNRDRLAKEETDRERRAKEEAARKARAEAAERGRQASREWAEKQKQKMLADKIKARVEAAKCA